MLYAIFFQGVPKFPIVYKSAKCKLQNKCHQLKNIQHQRVWPLVWHRCGLRHWYFRTQHNKPRLMGALCPCLSHELVKILEARMTFQEDCDRFSTKWPTSRAAKSMIMDSKGCSWYICIGPTSLQISSVSPGTNWYLAALKTIEFSRLSHWG